MKANGYFLRLALMAGLTVFTFTGSQAFASDDEWTDYDPCGWNVEQEATPQDLTLAEITEDQWTDYDPCGWSDEQETSPQERTLAEIAEDQWTDYDPCGWSEEQDTTEAELATSFQNRAVGEDYSMN